MRVSSVGGGDQGVWFSGVGCGRGWGEVHEWSGGMRKVNGCGWDCGGGFVVGEARDGEEGCRASKSACARPSGRQGGHMRCCFGVDGFARFMSSCSLPSSSVALRLLFTPLCGMAGRCGFMTFARCDVVRFGGASEMGLRRRGGVGREDGGSATRKVCSARQVVRMLEVIGVVGLDGGGESRREGGQ